MIAKELHSTEPRMKPDPRFLRQPKSFWANVRTISQQSGYTLRGKRQVKVPTPDEMCGALDSVNLTSDHLRKVGASKLTPFGALLHKYFDYRADALNNHVEPRLMNARQASEAFEKLRAKYPNSTCPIPMNKQKGEKRAPAFLTAMVNLIVEANVAGMGCDYDPRVLTTVTRDNVPLRTLSRRVDGAFPSSVNPHRHLGNQGILLHHYIW